jgi:hypothetical protein
LTLNAHDEAAIAAAWGDHLDVIADAPAQQRSKWRRRGDSQPSKGRLHGVHDEESLEGAVFERDRYGLTDLDTARVIWKSLRGMGSGKGGGEVRQLSDGSVVIDVDATVVL